MHTEFTPYLPAELDARPVLSCPEQPRLGRDLEYFLLRDGRPISRPRERVWDGAAFSGEWGQARACRLSSPDRVALILPLPAPYHGRELALVPHLPAEAVWRVVQSGLLGRAGEPPAPQNLRPRDEELYVYLSALLSRVRTLTHLPSGQARLPVTDRRELSGHLLEAARTVESVLGLSLPLSGVRPFPVRYPYEGHLHPALTHWMLFCLTLGCARGFSPQAVKRITVGLDEGLLIPRLEIPAGNKTPLPPELAECRALAGETGMFFDVTRHRGSIHIRFCPLIPVTSPALFYIVRSDLPLF